MLKKERLKKRLYRIALSKIRYYPRFGYYGGVFTPVEILSLVRNGIVVMEYYFWTVRRARTCVEEGVCNPMLIYFYGAREDAEPKLADKLAALQT